MFKLNYKLINFLATISNINNLSFNYGSEIAILGYSNVGKSTLINILANKKISRTSKKVGCTKFINIFEVISGKRIIDFPGYGYTNFSKKDEKKTKKMLYDYIVSRVFLKGVLLLIDIRFLLKDIDREILNKLMLRKVSITIVLTKSDKVSSAKKNVQYECLKKEISMISDKISIIIFSSKIKIGMKKLINTINKNLSQ
ncbi:ribosome biogenesis GTP-binding protein YihA/YsxC [Candidatus Tachikawaea gelatinosa]|uniref:Probable GTP-binding protein EngB n=1 Tax=Candidatus Tachikawaea gelatinosa TaxID=1410383 RepID=A0A090APR1_9ENTR|nr:ribosome biogenesis GTP-binding protein YihA/YsxC [Candidatus Tachikawaea gelatinosa]BAP58287.1 probable GTP-binding protein EngB [Candidatus Tachikawaea gelatinosa]